MENNIFNKLKLMGQAFNINNQDQSRISALQKNIEQQNTPGSLFLGYNIEDNGYPVFIPLKDRLLHLFADGPTGSGKTSMLLMPMAVSDFFTSHFTYNGSVEVPQLGQIIIDPKGDFAEQVWALGNLYKGEKRRNYLLTIVDVYEKIQIMHTKKSKELQSLKENGDVNSNKYKRLVIEVCNLKEVLDKVSNYMNNDWLRSHTTYQLFILATYMCNTATMPYYRSKLMNIEIDDVADRDQVLYFDPTSSTCPKFNPLHGDENDVIQSIVDTFSSFQQNSAQYFITLGSDLLTRAVKVIKRTYHEEADFVKLSKLLFNSNKSGETIIKKFSNVKESDPDRATENKDIAEWFNNEYLTDDSKSYADTSNIRSQLSKILQNEYLYRIFKYTPGVTAINFDEILENGDEVAISTARGTLGSQLSTYLGEFLIQQLQSCIFKRRGLAEKRVPCMLTIDEFQEFANENFASILTMGRSYGVAAHLATQSRGLILQKSDQGFLNTVDANCRNVVTFPGINTEDSKHFSEMFGQTKQIDEVYSRSTADEQKILKILNNNQKPDNLSIKMQENVQPAYDQTQLTYGATFYDERQDIENERNQKRKHDDGQRPVSDAFNTFGHIFFRAMHKGSIGLPGYAQVSFINRGLKNQIDEIVENYETINKITKSVDFSSFDRSQQDDLVEYIKQQRLKNIDTNESSSETSKKTNPEATYDNDDPDASDEINNSDSSDDWDTMSPF